MKELPILFSTPMVKAIQEKRKTMTRRTAGLDKVNVSPNDYYFQSLVLHACGEYTFAPIEPNGTPLSARIITCKPRYQVGDKLWVKETFTLLPAKILVFKAEVAYPDTFKWKSSLYMRKVYARIWLEVIKVGCERLQNITEADAVCEGIVPECKHQGEAYRLFVNLWEKINGTDSWLENPWVWVYEFKIFKVIEQ